MINKINIHFHFFKISQLSFLTFTNIYYSIPNVKEQPYDCSFQLNYCFFLGLAIPNPARMELVAALSNASSLPVPV